MQWFNNIIKYLAGLTQKYKQGVYTVVSLSQSLEAVEITDKCMSWINYLERSASRSRHDECTEVSDDQNKLEFTNGFHNVGDVCF